MNAETIELNQKYEEVLRENADLKAQLEWFRRHVFGSKSEKLTEPPRIENQLYFDELLEGTPDTSNESSETVSVEAHQRVKKNKKKDDQRIKIPEDLPCETVFCDIPENEKCDPQTGAALVQIGTVESVKLCKRPEQFFLKKIVRPKYANPKREEFGVKIADLKPGFIGRCEADETLLADILVKRFVDHLPYNRIESIFSRSGVKISRKVMANWSSRCAKNLEIMKSVMTQKILESGNIFMDETPVKYLLPGSKKAQTSYMWVLCGGLSSDPPLRTYHFFDNRRHENVEKIIGNYKGGLHSDKYGAYENYAKLEGISWFPCWSHSRRKFFDAYTQGSKEALPILKEINNLFELEQEAWKLSPDERLIFRKEREAPLIARLINQVRCLRKDRLLSAGHVSLRKACDYFLSLSGYLSNYLKNPFARLDNNVAERAIRCLALGRKNWLFFGSEKGGKTASTLLSLVQTCVGMGINPYDYLLWLMERLPDYSSQKLVDLLPTEYLLKDL